MITGIIYKYTNLINGKVYIGQTIQKLEIRDQKHISGSNDNTYFHKALKKYGRENFSLEVIESDIPIKELDEKEKLYIDLYNSFYTTGKGYNLTQGGKWGSGTQILTKTQSKEIKSLLINTSMTFQEIGNKYAVTIYAISDINRGKSFYDKDLKYPLRVTPVKSKMTEEKLEDIIYLLSTSKLTQKEIAEMVNVQANMIGIINRGESAWCPKELEYPIRRSVQENTYYNKLDPEEVKEICYELCFTNIPLEEIGKKFNIAKNTVGDISRGITWKNITQQFKCPIRKNKIENQKIYQSIYGIV